MNTHTEARPRHRGRWIAAVVGVALVAVIALVLAVAKPGQSGVEQQCRTRYAQFAREVPSLGLHGAALDQAIKECAAKAP